MSLSPTPLKPTPLNPGEGISSVLDQSLEWQLYPNARPAVQVSWDLRFRDSGFRGFGV